MRQIISICLVAWLAASDVAAAAYFDPRDPGAKDRFDEAPRATGRAGVAPPPPTPAAGGGSRVTKVEIELGGVEFKELLVTEVKVIGRDENGLYGAVVIGDFEANKAHTRSLGPMGADDEWFSYAGWPYVLTKRGRILTFPDSPNEWRGRFWPALGMTLFHRPYAITVFGGAMVLPALAATFGGGLAGGVHHLAFVWTYLASAATLAAGILTFELFKSEQGGRTVNRNFLTDEVARGVESVVPVEGGDFQVTRKGQTVLLSNLIGIAKRRRTNQSCADWLSAVIPRR